MVFLGIADNVLSAGSVGCGGYGSAEVHVFHQIL